MRHVNRRLLPYLVLLYVVAYLDRVNIGSAGLQMTRELGFSNAVFGLGGGIFYLGYMLLEIPGGVLAEVWSARKWIARILLTWGFLASATGLIHSTREFYWLRFLLGLAEAGFLPAILVYISHWYRPEDRGKAIAIFMASNPAAQVIGGPLSATLFEDSLARLQRLALAAAPGRNSGGHSWIHDAVLSHRASGRGALAA